MITEMSREHGVVRGMSDGFAAPRREFTRMVYFGTPYPAHTAVTTHYWRTIPSAVSMSSYLQLRSLCEPRSRAPWWPEREIGVLHADKSEAANTAWLYSDTPLGKEGQVRLTGPVRVLRKILTTWRLDGQAHVATTLLGLDETDDTLALNILAGRAELRGRDVKDRIVCLYQIRKTLHSLLRDETVENEWLREQHPGLDGDRPMDLMLEGTMENLLLVRDYVETIAGL